MSIQSITADTMKNIAPIFNGWDETLIWSCLQGCMGQAWADDANNPTVAQIITGDFCFLAGDAVSPQARELVGNIPANSSFILMASKDDSWHGLIEDVYKGRLNKHMRYAFKKDSDVFDGSVLRDYIGALPEGYVIAPIDEDLYHLTLAEKWSQDFCSQFPTYADYQVHGLGFVVLYDGKPVSGASSYTYYNGGVEIEIDTLEAYRRKGLATVCAARLILECLDRGLYPSWDAANRASVGLAEKLGYHFDREYVTYEITGFGSQRMTNTDLFTGKAEAYASARPSYPDASMDYTASLIPQGATVVDIGAGTGKFTTLLARYGYEIFAVEPNEDMKKQLAVALAPFPKAKIITGTAEATTLSDHSVDAITCAQALHWFDPDAFREECRRIGKPGVLMIAIYNNTPGGSSVSHSRQSTEVFFKKPTVREFANPQYYTREKWLRYMTSHSHDPLPTDPGYEAHITEMNAVFDRESVDGLLCREVVTAVYSERLDD